MTIYATKTDSRMGEWGPVEEWTLSEPYEGNRKLTTSDLSSIGMGVTVLGSGFNRGSFTANSGEDALIEMGFAIQHTIEETS